MAKCLQTTSNFLTLLVPGLSSRQLELIGHGQISSIPNSVRQYTVDVDYAGAISRGMDECSDKLRDTLHSTPWIPDSLRPSPPKRPTSRFAGRTAGIPSRGYFAALRHWMWRNQALTAAIIAFFGSGGLMLYYQHRAYRSKRRAKRGRDGSRTEVVGKSYERTHGEVC